jgi:outer membrane receptor for ferrienterochelin and colicins
MLSQRLGRLALIGIALLAAPLGLAAQTGAVTGRVVDPAGQPLSRVDVVAYAGATLVAGSTTSDAGVYRIANLPAGSYSIAARGLGFRPAGAQVTLAPGQVVSLDLTMEPAPSRLDPVVVTGTGEPERLLTAPAAIQVVEAEEIERRPTVTIADHVRTLPGVDATQGGIAQSNIVVRGFNNAFSGSLLTLQDHRFAGVPSLRVNVPLLFTGTNEDIERVEVLLGPAAALYGPNSANGVLHVITKSPFTSQGTSVSFDGGNRVGRAGLRHANTVGSKLGYKLSGEYLKGDDWRYFDPAEPDTFPTAVQAFRGRENRRDFNVERYSGEARLDWRPRYGMEFISTYALSNIGNAIELTGANGAAQARNWTYTTLQQRFRWNRLFAQVFTNTSDAGNANATDDRGTFLLRTGQPIVDQSRILVGQIQHATDFGGELLSIAGAPVRRLRFIYGGEYIKTDPRTGNTTHGLNEDEDNVTEYGGYIHSITQIAPRLEFIAAARADNNSRVDGTFISPRLGLQYYLSPNSNVRALFNRGYTAPATYAMFLDLPQANTPFATIRATGVHPDRGTTFARDCATGVGGLCMRTTNIVPVVAPLGIPGPNAAMDANAALLYPMFIAAGAQNIGAGITQQLVGAGVPLAQAQALAGNTVNRLLAARPTAAQVGTVLRAFSPSSAAAGGSPFPAVWDPSDVRNEEPLKPSFVNSYEVGYKGILRNRFGMTVDGWFQQRINFVSPAQLITPNVFIDPQSLAAFVAGQVIAELAPAIGQAGATALGTAIGTNVATSAAVAPIGTVTPEGPLYQRPDVVFSYRTVDRTIDVWGADFGGQYYVTDRFTLSGTYSYVSDGEFPDIPGGNDTSLVLNAPQHKASVSTRYQHPRGWGGEVRGRYNDAFMVNSAVYLGQVPVNAFLDASLNYRRAMTAGRSVLWSISAMNLLDNRVPSFIGVPDIGRLVTTRITYSF